MGSTDPIKGGEFCEYWGEGQIHRKTMFGLRTEKLKRRYFISKYGFCCNILLYTPNSFLSTFLWLLGDRENING